MTDWKLKLKAFLHDPPDKAISIPDHEKRAEELLSVLFFGREGDLKPTSVAIADQNASACDRALFPKNDAHGERLMVDFLAQPCVITHPLSGESLDVSKYLASVTINNADEAVQKAAEELRQKVRGDSDQDHRRRYLLIWRTLVDEIIRQDKKTSLGPLWQLIPADTRIPDHSLWDHQNITAAFAGTVNDPAFLIFSIGPVQDFIATARKTQDLWISSFILSYLSWQAMRVIAEQFGPDAIIFPSLRGQPLVDWWLHNLDIGKTPESGLLSQPSLPNKFLAVLPGPKSEDIAKKAEQEVLHQWCDELARKVRDQFTHDCGISSDYFNSVWQRQIENLIEIYWSIYPLPSSYEEVRKHYESLCKPKKDWRVGKVLDAFEVIAKGNKFNLRPSTLYASLHDLAGRGFDARKAIRNFNQQEEVGEKCTICGVRVSLHDLPEKESASRRKVREDFWEKKIGVRLKELGRYTDIRTDGSERLCAVCLTKRLAERYCFKGLFQKNDDEVMRFPSTRTIATATFKARILETLQNGDMELFEALCRYNQELTKAKIERTVSLKTLPFLNRIYESLQNIWKPEAKKFIEFDGDWLFVERLREERLEADYGLKFDNQTITDLQEAQADLMRVANEKHNIAPPSKYYAVFFMDGDVMGKWLQGEFMPNYSRVLHPKMAEALREDPNWSKILNQPRLLSPSVHAAMSRALSDFSIKLAHYVVEERHPGKLVYAGGDDVIAFIPVDHVLAVVRELRALYSGEVDEATLDSKEAKDFVRFGQGTGYLEFQGEILTTMGKNATASAGIAVAHSMQPLDIALSEMRHAEHNAKEKYERNAFCLHFIRRSGETRRTGAKWYNADIDCIANLLEVQKAIADGRLSGKFAYALDAQAEILESLPLEAQHAELRRIIKRHRDPKKMSIDEARQLSEKLEPLIGPIKVQELSRLLIFARFAATGGRDER